MRLFILICITFFSISSFAQTPTEVYKYEYDASGNRVKRFVETVLISPPPSNYAAVDTANQGGSNTTNNTSEESNQLSVSTHKVFPNPTFGIVTIEIAGNTSYQYSLYNSTGQLVKSGVLQTGRNTLNITDKQRGEYILNIIGEKNETWKIIKQ